MEQKHESHASQTEKTEREFKTPVKDEHTNREHAWWTSVKYSEAPRESER